MTDMQIVVVNAGSSTVKLALMEVRGGAARAVRRLQRECTGTDAAGVIQEALETLGASPDAIGHRVVHGGDHFSAPVRLTREVERRLETLVPLAPLHNGPALDVIRATGGCYPGVPAFAVFDTAFHAGRPGAAQRYGLPDDLVEGHRIRRYGFHGLAHASLVESLAAARDVPVEQVCAVTLQLGAGCSACAVRGGRSVETSMGFTPLEGLVMATRCGDIDPAIVVRLMRDGRDADWIEDCLTRRSGLAGLCGMADMRDILAAEADGDEAAALAVEVFCRRIVLTVGAYLTLLEGEGAVVFGGGIGTHSAPIRSRVAAGLGAWNVALDPARNDDGQPGCISADGKRDVFALVTDEESVIARQVAERLA